MNLEIERRHAIFNPDTRLKNDELRMKLLPKKGVSRHLSHILKPINENLGGQPVQKTIYTTNGFNRVKFDHDCFEKQHVQLMKAYTRSKNKAFMALHPEYEGEGPI